MLKKLTILTLTFLFTGCNQPLTKIANIEEASGIDYCKNSDSLIIANDEGFMYEITTDGKEIRTQNLGAYDLEGVVCTENEFVFAIEDGYLLFVDRNTLKSKRVAIDGYKFTDELGIEGIAINYNGDIYVSIQSKKKSKAKILKLEVKGKKYVVIVEISSEIKDSAGMTFYKDELYVVSDKKNTLYKYSFNKKRKVLISKLPKELAQEGITFDGYGYMYIANDNGGVYKFKEGDYK